MKWTLEMARSCELDIQCRSSLSRHIKHNWALMSVFAIREILNKRALCQAIGPVVRHFGLCNICLENL
jgi:hypothetical protein